MYEICLGIGNSKLELIIPTVVKCKTNITFCVDDENVIKT